MKYNEWHRQRRRQARALEEAMNPTLGKQRAKSRQNYTKRKERVAEMQAAFLEALRKRVAHRCYGDVTLPVGEVLARELTQVLQHPDRRVTAATVKVVARTATLIDFQTHLKTPPD
jgi:hypothetical protein